MVWFVYNLLFGLAFVLLTPHFLWRMKKRGGYRDGFGQRFGVFAPDQRERLQQGGWIWIHAVSVGELFVALRLLGEIREREPDSRFVVTVTTSTAHRLARQRLSGEDELLYFPIDAPWIMRRMLACLSPRRLILVEGELWPNLIRLASDRQIPVWLVNGRVSDSSFRGYGRVSWLTRRVLPRLQGLCMQSPRDAERMRALGAPAAQVHVMGSAKYDVARRDPGAEARAAALLAQAGLGPDRTLLLGGSTWPGEEAVLLEVFKSLRVRHSGLALVLVPRHAERRDEIVPLLENAGVSWARRSRGAHEPRPDGGPLEVLLVDTTGELADLYSRADLIFVGKSLTCHGGQNIIEPALYGKAICTGPHMENFPLVMSHFLEAEAVVQVPDAEALERAVEDLLKDPDARGALGRRAASVVETHRGSVQRTLDLLLPDRA